MSEIKWRLFRSGSCRHLERITLTGGRWQIVDYPALWALLEHPRLGLMMVDTGYAPRVVAACRKLPFWLYEKMTPMHITPEDSAVQQLARLGIGSQEIRHLFLTHFHADHLGGVRDFPNAKIYASSAAWRNVQGLGNWAALRQAFIPELLPEDFTSRLEMIDDTATQPLPNGLRGIDFLGDSSLYAIPLPGHATGQMGLWWAADPAQRPVLLAADAAWHTEAITEQRGPSTLVKLITPDWTALQQTLTQLQQLHQRHPETLILPCHCQHVARRFLEP